MDSDAMEHAPGYAAAAAASPFLGSFGLLSTSWLMWAASLHHQQQQQQQNNGVPLMYNPYATAQTAGPLLPNAANFLRASLNNSTSLSSSSNSNNNNNNNSRQEVVEIGQQNQSNEAAGELNVAI